MVGRLEIEAKENRRYQISGTLITVASLFPLSGEVDFTAVSGRSKVMLAEMDTMKQSPSGSHCSGGQ